MILAQEDHGGAGFDEEQELGGLFYWEEVCDGLLYVIVEDLEVFAAEAFDEVACGVGYGDAYAHAIYGDTDWRGLLSLSLGQRAGAEQK
jgi:hypothetical protein